MANTDISVTLAGQFANNVLSENQRLIISCLGLEFKGVLGGGTKPTVAQWDTVMAAATKLWPSGVASLDIDALETAICWNQSYSGISAINAGLAVTGQSNSTLLGAANYLQGFEVKRLRLLRAYLLGRVFQNLT
jgi:hypothetical protein